MCSKVRSGDIIITYSLSRLARNTKQFNHLKSLSVRLICVKEFFYLKYEHGEISQCSLCFRGERYLNHCKVSRIIPHNNFHD